MSSVGSVNGARTKLNKIVTKPHGNVQIYTHASIILYDRYFWKRYRDFSRSEPRPEEKLLFLAKST